jgi:CheY-like chemotaxis protein
LECKSSPGCGTTFRIFLPASGVVFQGKDAAEAEKPEEAASGSGSEHILVVDDESSLLDIWKDVLGHFGYRVTTASSGEEALEVFSEVSPDLIILDMNMPGMGGLRCLERLIKRDSSARVIISSGHHEDDQVEKALHVGAQGFLGKPYTVESLLTEIRKIMDSGIGVQRLEGQPPVYRHNVFP